MLRLILIICLFFGGCNSLRHLDKLTVPLSIPAAYCATIGLHEGGHTLAAYTIGARHIKVDIFPSKINALGYTRIRKVALTPTRNAIFAAGGPISSSLAHIGLREILKSGEVPRSLQPFLTCTEIFSHGLTYYHAISGLMGRNTDLGDQPRWISVAVLITNILYDAWDFYKDGLRRFKVLFAQEYYTKKGSSNFLVGMEFTW